MLHKNKGVNKIKNEDGMETRIRGRQKHHHNNNKPEVEEGKPRPMKQLYTWYTEGNHPMSEGSGWASPRSQN